MIPCEERDRLLKLNEAAWQEYYKRKNNLERLMMLKERSRIGDARREANKAEKCVSHAMTAILNHYPKHGCNKD